MTKNEARVRVRLDTRGAQKDLQKIGKSGQAAADRVSGRINAGGGSGFAVGAGIGAAVGAVGGLAKRAGMFAGAGEYVSSFTTPLQARAEAAAGVPGIRAFNFAKGAAGDMGLARMAGIAELANPGTGAGKAEIARARPLIESIRQNRLPEEVGRNLIDQEVGVGAEAIKKVADKVEDGTTKILVKMVELARAARDWWNR